MRKGFHEVRDVHNIADILIDPEGARPWRDHWEKSAHSLLTGAILHVLYAEEEKTLARVAAFLADPARSIRRTMWVMLTTNHLGTEEQSQGASHRGLQSARELLNKTDNERSGVVSTAMTLLGLYRDPDRRAHDVGARTGASPISWAPSARCRSTWWCRPPTSRGPGRWCA